MPALVVEPNKGSTKRLAKQLACQGGSIGVPYQAIANVVLPKTLESLACVTLRISAPPFPNVTPPRNVCEPPSAVVNVYADGLKVASKVDSAGGSVSPRVAYRASGKSSRNRSDS